MYGRLITFMVVVLVGLAGAAFFMNWLWVKAFGPGVPAQQHTQEDAVEAKKKLREEHDARQAEKFEKGRHSEKAIAEAAHAGVAKPLSAQEFDPATGTIHWPEVLLEPRFHEERGRVENLSKAAAAKRDPALIVEMHSAVSHLIESFKAAIHDLPTKDYIAARHFLDSLEHWAKEHARE